MKRLTLFLAVACILQAQQPAQPARKLTFNGRPLTTAEMARLEQVERIYRFRLPDLAYWYDNVSGAAGLWKGPTAGFLPAGLGFGGKMPPDCSTGGTGVFVNGRELHPIDVMALRQITMVLPGRWWVDANGNGGPEGGPVMFNLVVLARQAGARGAGGAWSRRVQGAGTESMYVGGDGGFLYFMDSKGASVYVDR